MADGRGARNAAARNGGRGAGTVEFDGKEDQPRPPTLTEVIAANNEYGGRTLKSTFREFDGGTPKDVRVMVVKYDKDGVVMERVYRNPP